MIAILDYGVGNLVSIRNMISKAGGESIITSDSNEIAVADKYILPGIGSFDHGISNLRSAPYFDILNERITEKKVPILGVCLGVQLFTESSEEGKLPGLGWIKGNTVRFSTDKMNNHRLKVPHMGWTDVKQQKASRLFTGMYDEPRFYFVHSYHLQCADDDDVLVKGNYGYDFVAGVERENVVGVQFHPEKSHKFGLKVYENFIRYY